MPERLDGMDKDGESDDPPAETGTVKSDADSSPIWSQLSVAGLLPS